MEIGPDTYRITADNLPDAFVQEELGRLKTDLIIERIWDGDYSVWSAVPTEISNRLGWLHSHRVMEETLPELKDFIEQIRAEGFNQALLLGMGGSSLAPEIFRKIFRVREGFLNLDIMDSTDPGAVLEKEKNIDLHKTLFIVSTKSGGTVETLSLMKYFYNKSLHSLGRENAGKHFIAITDPGSGLEKTAKELAFRKVFLNDPDIGGRYSALSYFGLVPAGLIGVDLKRLLQSAEEMSLKSRTFDLPFKEGNTPAVLGTILGVLSKKGRDKLTFIASPELKAFGMWLEQLLAESTGKAGKGILPVVGETIRSPEAYAGDRLFVYFRLNGDSTYDDKVKQLKQAGHPVIWLSLNDIYGLGGEMFRWMMATAVAGWAMGINPFDQPNVESAKVLTRKIITKYREKGELDLPSPDLKFDNVEVYLGSENSGAEDLKQIWRDFFKLASRNKLKGRGLSYVAVQAYLQPGPETDLALQGLRDKIGALYQMAVTVGYGPRFLHSTGQLHKGDAGHGLFIQLTSKSPQDVPIPDQPGSDHATISFNLLISAQALGDRQALLEAGRKVIHFQLGDDTPAAINKLTELLV